MQAEYTTLADYGTDEFVEKRVPVHRLCQAGDH